MAIIVTCMVTFPCSTNCVAEDRFFALPGRSTLVTMMEDAEQERPSNRPKNQKRLREGTLVPPTIGRIVLKGRRWEFVSEGAAPVSDDTVASTLPRRSRLVRFTSPPPPTRFNSSTIRRSGTTARPLRTLVTTPAASNEKPLALPATIILCENLMLQRIAEAIRANPSDDQWIVAGEITEFFDENRLIIRTAQRSNAN